MPVSNPPTLLSVIAEFGGPNNLGAYYRKGPYVPDGPPQNANISDTPGGLRLSQFAGAVKYNLSASLNRTTANTSGSGNSQSGRVLTPQLIVYPVNGSGNYSYYWNYTAGVPVSGNTSSTFQLYADLNNGQNISGNGNCVVTDNVTGQNAIPSFTFYLSWTYERPPTCVVMEAYLHDGKQAGMYNSNDPLLLVDPYARTSETLNIVDAQTFTRECVTLVTANGSRLTCSTTAPIPVKADSETLVRAVDALGHHVATTTRPNDVIPSVTWDKVVRVLPAGERAVRNIYIYDKCFWASDDNRSFILHHNTTGKQII